MTKAVTPIAVVRLFHSSNLQWVPYAFHLAPNSIQKHLSLWSANIRSHYNHIIYFSAKISKDFILRMYRDITSCKAFRVTSSFNYKQATKTGVAPKLHI